jgi:AmiR/NasT family two-component response regulator
MELRLTRSALVIGDAGDAHFRECAAWLNEHLASHFVANLRAALALSDDDDPAVIMLLQSRPGEFPEAELDLLRRRWPLARLVGVFGSWTEGEPRNGPAARGVYRIAWHAAVERLSQEFGGGRLLDLPATATADERLLANARPMSAQSRVIAVAALRASWAEPLVDGIAAAGNAAVYWPLDRHSVARGIDAVVWDVFGCEHDLPRYRSLLPGAKREVPVVATMDFARPQDIVKLAELGVTRVLGKPLLMADLLGCVDSVCARAQELRPVRAAVA